MHSCVAVAVEVEVAAVVVVDVRVQPIGELVVNNHLVVPVPDVDVLVTGRLEVSIGELVVSN